MGEKELPESNEEEGEQGRVTDQPTAEREERRASCGSQELIPAAPQTISPGQDSTDSTLRFSAKDKLPLRVRSALVGTPRKVRGTSVPSSVRYIASGCQSALDPSSCDPPWPFRWRCTKVSKLTNISKGAPATSGLFETGCVLRDAMMRLQPVHCDVGYSKCGTAGSEEQAGKVPLLDGASVLPSEQTSWPSLLGEKQLARSESHGEGWHSSGPLQTASAASEAKKVASRVGVLVVLSAPGKVECEIRVAPEARPEDRGQRPCPGSLVQVPPTKEAARTAQGEDLGAGHQAEHATSLAVARSCRSPNGNDTQEAERLIQPPNRRESTTNGDVIEVKKSSRLEFGSSGRRQVWYGVSDFAALGDAGEKEEHVPISDAVIHKAAALCATPRTADRSAAPSDTPCMETRQGTDLTLSTAASSNSFATSTSQIHFGSQLKRALRSVERELRLGNTRKQLDEKARKGAWETEPSEPVAEEGSRRAHAGRIGSEQVLKRRTPGVVAPENAESDNNSSRAARSHTSQATAREPRVSRLDREVDWRARSPQIEGPAARVSRVAGGREGGKEKTTTCPGQRGRRRRGRGSRKKPLLGSGNGGWRDAEPKNPCNTTEKANPSSIAAAHVRAGARSAGSRARHFSSVGGLPANVQPETPAAKKGDEFFRKARKSGSPGPPSRGSRRPRGRRSRRRMPLKKSSITTGERCRSPESRRQVAAATAGGPFPVRRDKETKPAKEKGEALVKPGHRGRGCSSRQVRAEHGVAPAWPGDTGQSTAHSDASLLDASRAAALVGHAGSLLSRRKQVYPCPSTPSARPAASCGRSTFAADTRTTETDPLLRRKRDDSKTAVNKGTRFPAFHDHASPPATGVSAASGGRTCASCGALESKKWMVGAGMLTTQTPLRALYIGETQDPQHLTSAEQCGGRPVLFASAPNCPPLPYSARPVNDKPGALHSALRAAGVPSSEGGPQLGSRSCRLDLAAEYAAPGKMPNAVRAATASQARTSSRQPSYPVSGLPGPGRWRSTIRPAPLICPAPPWL